jgi:hypothetical protein
LTNVFSQTTLERVVVPINPAQEIVPIRGIPLIAQTHSAAAAHPAIIHDAATHAIAKSCQYQGILSRACPTLNSHHSRSLLLV